MSDGQRIERQHGNAYGIFILVLTIQSLFVMVGILLPVSDAVRETLQVWDTVICVIFLFDFGYTLAISHPRRGYFVDRLGWLDLIGSIPALGLFRFAVLLRLARVARLMRIARQLGGQQGRELVRDILRNRGQYAFLITLLLVLIVLTTSSVLVLQFESGAPNANITTGGDALWWAIVTLTTVGYGDHFPVTTLGRVTAVFVMFAGIGIIGALASIMASFVVSPPEAAGSEGGPASDEQPAGSGPVGERSAPAGRDMPVAEMMQVISETRAELAHVRAELALIRSAQDQSRASPSGGQALEG